MKNSLLILILIITTFLSANGQEKISPLNNPVNIDLLKSGTSKMQWFMVQDSVNIPIGIVETQIEKKEKKIYVLTTVEMSQSPIKWVDSTVVSTKNFEPIYHSSYNQQRDVVLNFEEQMITGSYLDKITNTKNQLSETTNKAYFDSNFYPQLIRLLPLKTGYSGIISIFDYNPKSKTGVMSATIKNTENTLINFKGKNKEVWKVLVSDDISNNQATSTYYIDKSSRKILKQEIKSNGRKMVMEIFED